MALGRKLEFVFETEAPYSICCIKWQIHHFFCLDSPLNSCEFSTDTGEVCKLESVQPNTTSPIVDLYCTLSSARASNKTNGNVYCNVSCRLGDKERMKLTIGKRQLVARYWLPLEIEPFKDEDDNLTLNVTLEFCTKGTVEVSNTRDVTPKQTLNSSVTSLLANNSLTDVTLKVKEKELKAHKVILAAMSPVFEAMFQEGYKEHEDNYVNIEDMDSDVFEVFLRYLYSGQVDKLEEMFTVLLADADKYDVQPLREICIQHMPKNISVDNAVDVLALADRHSVESVKSLALQFIKFNFADFVKTKFWASFLENYPHDVKRMRPLSNKTPL